MKHRTIGIVGGMGPQAGVMLHEAIVRHTSAKIDQEHLSVILMTFPQDIQDRTQYLCGLTSENPAHKIVEVIKKLDLAGAEVIGIPCNTSHAPRIFDQIQEYIEKNMPRVNLLYLPTEVLSYMDINYPETNRIGLMMTNGTYKSQVYSRLLRNHRFEVVIPDYEFQNEVIHKLIYDPQIGIKSNPIYITVEAIALWRKSLNYFKNKKVDTILLACTELSLVPLPRSVKDLNVIDTIEILAKALIREATALPARDKEDIGISL